MEKSERDIVTRNLPRLISDTVCSHQLLSNLLSTGTLIESEADEIRCRTTSVEKAYYFYRLIQTKRNGYNNMLEALQATNQTGVLALLGKRDLDFTSKTKRGFQHDIKTCKYGENFQLKRGRPTKSNIRFGVKAPSQLFTGRDEELQEIHKILCNHHGQRVTVITQLTSISGLGGIGKTQLARQYIHKHSSDFDNNIIWINAEREESLSESFRNLAKDKLGITTKDANGGEKDITAVVGEIYQIFENSRALFVFDNAEKGSHLRKFLPEPLSEQNISGSLPSILITSRDLEWEVNPSHLIKLNEMKLEEAVEFTRKGLRLSATDDSTTRLIRALVNKLQCYPLALQQAISYINEQNEMDDYNIQNYLDEIESNQEELLDSDAFRGINDDYERTTFTTWRMTVVKIACDVRLGSIALDLLNCMAYLSAENVERSMLLPLLSDRNEKKLKTAVRLLIRYSMISGEEKQSKLSIHRLVQQVTRLELEATGCHEDTLEKVLRLLQPLNKNEILVHIDHALCAWSHANSFANLVEKFREFPRDIARGMVERDADKSGHVDPYVSETGEMTLQLLERNLSLQNSSQVSSSICIQVRLEPLLEKLLDAIERWKDAHLKKENSQLSSEQLIMDVHFKQRKAEMAFEFSLGLADRKRNVLGLLNVRTVESIFAAGLCYRELRNTEADMIYFQMNREEYEKVPYGIVTGEIKAVHSLGLLLGDVGKSNEAVEVLQDLFNKNLSVEWTVRVRHSLAFTLYNQGKYEEAFNYCKQALGKKVGNPNVNFTLNLMRLIKQAESNYGSSRGLQQKDKWLELWNEEFHSQIEKGNDDFISSVYHDDGALAVEDAIQELEDEMGIASSTVLKAYLDFADVLEKEEEYHKCLSILEEIQTRLSEQNCNRSSAEVHALDDDIRKIDESIVRVRQKYTEKFFGPEA